MDDRARVRDRCIASAEDVTVAHEITGMGELEVGIGTDRTVLWPAQLPNGLVRVAPEGPPVLWDGQADGCRQ